MSRKSKQKRERVVALVRAAGAERSEAEGARTSEAGDVIRGRPERRSSEERTRAVLELLTDKASVDQLARRFGAGDDVAGRAEIRNGRRRRFGIAVGFADVGVERCSDGGAK